MQNNLVILTIPGAWASRADVLSALAEDFLFASQPQEGVRIEFRKGRRRNVLADFWWAGLHWQDTTEMSVVRRHTSNVTLTTVGGSPQRMRKLMTAATAVVRAGGLGVHVAHVGIAHTPRKWLELDSEGLDGIHRAFVVTIDGPVGDAYSCGMHNFGLREVSVPSDIPNRANVVGIITRHLLVKGARIERGQTIAIGHDANRYSFRDVQSAFAPDGAIFEHQVGTWQLVHAEAVH